MESFAETVRLLTDHYALLWAETPATAPGLLRRFTPGQKAEKEKDVNNLLEKSVKQLDRFHVMEDEERERYLGRAHTALGRLLMRTHDPSVDGFFEACELAGKAFVRGARQIDPSISDEDLHQALRNQWVFNSLQSYLGRPVTLSSSSLGYSLMYPYTDNLIDGAGRTASVKDRFNHLLQRCLEGDRCADTEGELGVFPALLSLIEDEYPRPGAPAVYESLIAIHRAQQRSMILHRSVEGLEESFLQALTIEKGGTSVAADGYLVAGALGTDALHAIYGYGVVLQFIDDLQDIEDDRKTGHSTMFTRGSASGPLDGLAARLLNFTSRTVHQLDRPLAGRKASLPDLIEASCVFLILEAVARHSGLFTAPYLRMIEEFSPLRFSFLAGLHDRVRTTMAEREHVFM